MRKKPVPKRPGRMKACAQCGTMFYCIASKDVGGTLPEQKNCSAPCAHKAIRKDMEPSFWSKVDKEGPGGCWIWTASRKERGYGQFLWRGKMHRAHRLAWVLSGQELPAKGLELAHTCDVRHCVNPAHLYVATHQQNVADTVARGRTRSRHSPYEQLLYPEHSIRRPK